MTSFNSNISSFPLDPAFAVFSCQGEELVDLPRREELRQLPWYSRIFYLREISSLNHDFLVRIKRIFQEKFGIANERIFEWLWREALSSHRIEWENEACSIQTLNRMEAALRDTLAYQGAGIKADTCGPHPEVHQVFQFFLGRGELSLHLANQKNLKGIFLDKDPDLLQGMQEEIRAILAYAADHLPIENSREEKLFQAFIGNMIALLPYGYPEEGQTYTIPQKIHGRWQKCLYTVERKIELTPKWFATPITAYGLTSLTGSPLLTFLGTTYPAGDGFISTILTDITPGCSIGKIAYQWGKDRIEEWMGNKRGVSLFGVSLGGALSFHLLKDRKEQIASLHVYNPPGFYPWEWDDNYNAQEINIYLQENDLVSKIGTFPKGALIYRILPHTSEGIFSDHVRIYSSFERVTLLQTHSDYENSKFVRKICAGSHFILSVLLFFPILSLYALYLSARQIQKLFHLMVKGAEHSGSRI